MVHFSTYFPVALICVLLGAFVAAAEAAITSLPEARLLAMRDELSESRARHLTRYLDDPHALLSRWLTFRVTMLVVGSELASAIFVPAGSVWRTMGVVIGVVLIYATIVEIFSSISRERAIRLAPWALRVTRPVEWIMAPVAIPIAAIGRVVRRLAKAPASELNTATVTQREVEYVVEAAESTGALDARRGEMLQNVLEFKDLTVRELMVPRTKMTTLSAATPIQRALHIVSEDGHSRIPVYDGSVDNIVGVLHVKDLFHLAGSSIAIDKTEIKQTLLSLVRKPVLHVPTTQTAIQLLRDMQSRRTHMAIVIDEFGAVAGIVTLEDLLEELVGEIADEHDDVEDAEFVEQSADQYVAAAGISIGHLAERLGLELPESESYASLGGFLAEHAGRVPVPGTVVQWQNLTFTVREGDARRATKVEIVRNSGPAETTHE
jgi:CBS domain containing-hemolysin-like protein